MTIRSLFTVLALAALPAPALAGDGPPPLPDDAWYAEDEYYEDEHYEGGGYYDDGYYEDGYYEDEGDWGEEPYRGDPRGGWYDPGVPVAPAGARYAYSPQVRAAWIDDCRRGGRSFAECEDILRRYERGGADYGQPGYAHAGPGYPHTGAAYGYGAFGYPGPVMWVRVPIMTTRRRVDCGCEQVVEEVVEEWVEEEVIEERVVEVVPDKRVKIERVPAPAPIKTKTVRYKK